MKNELREIFKIPHSHSKVIQISILALQKADKFLERGEGQKYYEQLEFVIKYLENCIECYLDECELRPATIEDVKEKMIK